VRSRNKVLICLIVFLALGSRISSAQTPAPTPSFTLSAANVTMPSSGVVQIPFTLTSVNGFAGSVGVLCVEPTIPGSVNKGPYCDQGGPLMAYTLAANGTTTGSISIVAIQPNPVPLTTKSSLAGHEASWALAGALVLGFGLRRKRMLRFSRVSLAAFLLIGLAGLGIFGCGGPPTLTPGTYNFMLNATSVSANPALYATTTATVTVPAGIVTSNSTH